MSTDYYAVCSCGHAHHLFVRFTSGPTFGHGTNDAEGKRAAAEWLLEHAGTAEDGHAVRVVVIDAVPDSVTFDDD